MRRGGHSSVSPHRLGSRLGIGLPFAGQALPRPKSLCEFMGMRG